MSKADMSKADVRICDPVLIFAALGDPTRLSLLAKLGDGEMRSITELSTDMRVTRQAVTKHLHVLEDAGLVSHMRSGRESRYACRPETIAEAKAYLDKVSAQWDATLSRLRAFVEE